MAENNDDGPQEQAGAGPARKPGTWAKGTSGNPGGRPRVVTHVQSLAREHTTEAIATLAEAMRDVDPRVRCAASQALLSRAWGNPSTPVEIEAAPEPDEEPVSLLQLAREVAFSLRLGLIEAAKQGGDPAAESTDNV